MMSFECVLAMVELYKHPLRCEVRRALLGRSSPFSTVPRECSPSLVVLGAFTD